MVSVKDITPLAEAQQVILVNELDEQTGVAGKMEAHEKGLLHRAFSIFIFNNKGEMLLQQRALHKYHSGGLWTNACCSHPVPGEDMQLTVSRRLFDEMGFVVALERVFTFVYRADFENGLTEYEYDHVWAGEYSGKLDFNLDEVMDASYYSLAAIQQMLDQEPQKFTEWFRIAFPMIVEWRAKQSGTKS